MAVAAFAPNAMICCVFYPQAGLLINFLNWLMDWIIELIMESK